MLRKKKLYGRRTNRMLSQLLLHGYYLNYHKSLFLVCVLKLFLDDMVRRLWKHVLCLILLDHCVFGDLHGG
ncbi:hypothetical protein L2E82_48490 [Cichorium intybus]|uniref:Uncharacterized protein n=1 Tax=Cichorium intybus TaxID=13427 RepID=A0ACB8YXH2_CICIN|nr:hypothetical protein L2E82_48490 [Cichorium intybus]